MKVFNLTDAPLQYRGHTIPAHGSIDFSDLTFVPDRDKVLEKNKVLAFGSLPQWYEVQREIAVINQAQARAAATKALEPVKEEKTPYVFKNEKKK